MMSQIHKAAYNGHTRLIYFLADDKKSVTTEDDYGYVPLHYAAMNGHTEALRVLVSRGAEINTPSRHKKQTAIHFAARHGRISCLDFMKNVGADINVKDSTLTGKAPIHLAVKYGQMNATLWLLDNGVSVNSRTTTGLPPIFFAIKHNHDNLVEILIQRKASVNAKISHLGGITLLHEAVKTGNEVILKLLLNNGANESIHIYCGVHKQKPIHWAAKYGHIGSAKLLKEYNCGLSDKCNNDVGNCPIHLAAKDCQIEMVDWLLNCGVLDVVTNNFGYSILHIAAAYAHYQLIEYLTQRGYDFNMKTENEQQMTALSIASFKGNIDIIRLLLQYHSCVNLMSGKKHRTALSYAVMGNKLKCLIELVNSGGNYLVNIEENDGESLMVTAAKHNSDAVMMWLIEKGIPTDIKNNKGMTPLHYAAKLGKKKVMQQLIDAGAVVDAEDNMKNTPLHYAVLNRHFGAIEILVTEKANVNVQNAGGLNALHIAAIKGFQNITKYLITKCGDPLAPSGNDFGDLPIHYASTSGKESIIKLYLENNFDLNAPNKLGYTSLMYACMKSKYNFAKMLIENGAEVNIKSKVDCRTALHLAAAYGHVELVELLLSNNADANIVTSTTLRTSLHWAVLNSHFDVVKLLVNHTNITAVDKFGMSAMDIASVTGEMEILNYLKYINYQYKIDRSYTSI